MTSDDKRKLAIKLLDDAKRRIQNDTCGVELDSMIEFFAPIVRRKLNAEEVCNHYGISRATLTRWLSSGKIPQSHKEPGGKIYWYMDELP